MSTRFFSKCGATGLAVDRPMILQPLGPRLPSAWQHRTRFPILHLSMHGDSEGVGLTSSERVSWDDLRQRSLRSFGLSRGATHLHVIVLWRL